MNGRWEIRGEVRGGGGRKNVSEGNKEERGLNVLLTVVVNID